jgi:hypothetical protein
LDATQIAVHGFGTVENVSAFIPFPVEDIKAVGLLDDGFVVDRVFVLFVEKFVKGVEVLFGDKRVFANLTTDREGVAGIEKLDKEGA